VRLPPRRPSPCRGPPTLARFRAALWNPANPSLLALHPFGVGWTVNLTHVRELLGRG
jgi:hypothetical protein